VPVSLIGTFAGIYLLGYSINTLTLFGMVLAIGIVVDDAIVVLENVERIMREEGLPPRDAAVKAMHEVTGPIIAIVLTLTAVFVPIAFLGGLTGELYRQFAVTISISVVLSGIVALTLSPSLCVIMLKHGITSRTASSAGSTAGSAASPGTTLRRRRLDDPSRRARAAAVRRHGGDHRASGARRRAAWCPDEDQGFYIGAVFLPDGATLERTDPGRRAGQAAVRSNPNNQDVVAFTGFDFIGGGFRNNAATVFVTQKHWDERQTSARSSSSANVHENRTAHQGSAGTGLQSAGDLRSRHRRRLRVLHPEPRRRRFRRGCRRCCSSSSHAPTATRSWRRADAVARQRAAALRRRRPREGEGARRADRRGLQHAVGHARHLLRERLQQVRPHLAGADVRRTRVPQAAGRHLGELYVRAQKGEMVPLSALAT
jgi:multidrug efflux pump subunit AcrB